LKCEVRYPKLCFLQPPLTYPISANNVCDHHWLVNDVSLPTFTTDEGMTKEGMSICPPYYFNAPPSLSASILVCYFISYPFLLALYLQYHRHPGAASNFIVHSHLSLTLVSSLLLNSYSVLLPHISCASFYFLVPNRLLPLRTLLFSPAICTFTFSDRFFHDYRFFFAHLGEQTCCFAPHIHPPLRQLPRHL
jgi:hypothetical protein